jgi:hypothetical protein
MALRSDQVRWYIAKSPDDTDCPTEERKNRIMFAASAITSVATELLPARPIAFTRVMEMDRRTREGEPPRLGSSQTVPGSPLNWMTTQPVSDIGTFISRCFVIS